MKSAENINDGGGTAFPVECYGVSYGMSLRAWFAGQVMAAMISGYLASDKHLPLPGPACADACMWADTMLKELEKEGEIQ